jgi:hypothetical protein
MKTLGFALGRSVRKFGIVGAVATLFLSVGTPGLSLFNSVAKAERAGGLGAGILDLGAQSTCSVRTNGGVRCFGPNLSGQNGPSSLTADMFSSLYVPIGGINPRTVSAGDTTTCYASIAGQQQPAFMSCVGAVPLVNVPLSSLSVGKNGVCRQRPRAPFPLNNPPTNVVLCSGADDGSGWAGGSDGSTVGVAFTNTANPAIEGFPHIALSGSNSCATVYNPSSVLGVRCWGLPTSPVLGGSSLSTPIAGLPSTIDALAITPNNGCVLSSGSVYCWGSATTGVAPGPVGTPVPIVGTAKAIALGGQGACALLTVGAVRCWGGQYSTPTEAMVFGPDQIGSPAVVSAVAMAENHSCVQLTTDEVRCWGDPLLLGGSSKNASVPFVVQQPTRIDAGPVDGSVSDRTVAFYFSAPQYPALPFVCQIDGAAAVPCTSPVTYTLTEGSHTFSVALTGSGTDPTPATRTWTVSIPKNSYSAITPQRILDTRGGPIFAVGELRSLVVTGVAGIPANATSVALNVAAVTPAGAGHLRIYPAGSPRPNASVLNFPAGKNVPNHVIVKVGVGGQISIYAGGSTHVIVDVAGYFAVDEALTQFVAVDNPTTIYESPLAGVTAVNIDVVGRGGLLSAANKVVAINVGALAPLSAGHLRVWTTGEPMPNASTNNFVAGDSRMNLVLVRPNAAGQISVYNAASAPVTLRVDPVGAFGAGIGYRFRATDPQRTLDTRTLGAPVPAGGFIEAQIRGFGTVPDSFNVRSVAVNIAAVSPQAAGSIDVGQGGQNPTLPTLRHPANENVANLALVTIGFDGTIRLVNNSSAPTHMIVDINGYFGV